MNDRSIAYFSMEMALRPDMPTYSGGLGMLAGDNVRSAADLKLAMVAVTLLHRQGYFAQKLDASGWLSFATIGSRKQKTKTSLFPGNAAGKSAERIG